MMMLAMPALLYGSECWILPQQWKGRLEAAEMRFLITASGYRQILLRRSEHTREELQIAVIN
jgi:hypothetical protein